MRIAVDAMGTDKRPIPDVLGAVLAARETGDTMLLVGNETSIKQELRKYNHVGLKIEVVPALEEIIMTDKPVDVLKSKLGSSMHIGMRLVKDNLADGFVTMGNTGAAHAIATLGVLRRISGIRRPALSGIYPIGGYNTTFLDIGANADSKVDWMVQFAFMGSIYTRSVLGIARPRVGLLSNGEEEGKGNQLIRDTATLLKDRDINFVGNVEPKEVMTHAADVIVTDGFVGNIFAKTFEASTTYLSQMIRDELTRNVFSKLGALLMRSAFKRVRKYADTFEVGGAPLLGVNGVVIIGHGRSNEIAIKNAIHQARKAIQTHTLDAIREELSKMQS